MRALVVDDSTPARMLAGQMLANLGFEVYESVHGGQALEVLARLGPVEVVLLDWNMPDVDGIQFLQALRQDRAMDAVAVVMATSNADAESVATAMGAGANEYVMKPFLQEDLAAKLRILGFEFAEGVA